MSNESKFANAIKSGEFIITAEYLPEAVAADLEIKTAASFFKGVTAVNVSDNPFGVVMSSLAASVALSKSGIEPVYQIVTRDRNRIALQSDLLGAASLGIKNVLCISGYHQTLGVSPESANVYDLDSIQLIAGIEKMKKGELLNGTKIKGTFSMLVGAAANPYMKPLVLNIIRLVKKVEAGAAFIQTNAVFDIEGFNQWLDAARNEGITEKTAILAGVLPLDSAKEAEELKNKYTEIVIPDAVIDRLKSAGNEDAQKKEGLAICSEVIKRIKGTKGVKGIHIHSGGKEKIIAGLLSAAGLN
ncbi:MAG: methylenetetrahydrofolate reductase [Spirochaetota bacterium]